jgi:hypothetical protein
MAFDTLPHQLAWSLLIGAEIFAIAALWPLSEWASSAWRRGGFVIALVLAASCIALDTHAFALARLFNDADRRARLEQVLAWLVVPLFLSFPGAVCVASAQSLRHAGVPARAARVLALLVAAFAAVVAPLAALAAGCGLAGMCL